LTASPQVIDMHTLTADKFLQQSLSSLSGLTEVRDAQGIVLGYFSPASQKSPEAYAQAAAHFDPEEMKRRMLSQEKGRTTNEVLSRIAALEK
jgi:hypothetical protein